MPLEPNTIVGKYKVGKLVGFGGFADVYNVKKLDGSLKGKFVLKKILLKNPRGESREQMIRKEIRMLRAVSPLENFPTLVDNFRLGDSICLVMSKEYADFHDLLDKNPKLSFTMTTVQKIGYKVVENLRALHELGIMHRDIKRENICIRDTSGNAKVVIIDFGIAKKFLNAAGVRLPPRVDERQRFDRLPYSSVEVLQTNINGENDDIIMACYALAEFRGLYGVVNDDDPAINLTKKLEMKRDPHSFFGDRHRSLADVFQIVHAQPRFETPNYEAILESIKNMVPGFDPNEQWSWRWSEGMYTLV